MPEANLERRVIAKLSRRILPLIFLSYLVAVMDFTTMTTDTRQKGADKTARNPIKITPQSRSDLLRKPSWIRVRSSTHPGHRHLRARTPRSLCHRRPPGRSGP